MFPYQMMVFENGLFCYLLFLVETLLVTVWYAETSGVENVRNLEAAENALNLSPTGTLHMKQQLELAGLLHTSQFFLLTNDSWILIL